MTVETLPEKVKDRDFIIACLCVVIILLLLYWRHIFVTGNGDDYKMPDINIPQYTFPVGGIVQPKPGRDWGQTTDMSCGCGGDDFFHDGGPILSPPSYIYVSSPPLPALQIQPLSPMPPAQQIDLPSVTIPSYTYWVVVAPLKFGANFVENVPVYQSSDGHYFYVANYHYHKGKLQGKYSIAIDKQAYVFGQNGDITYGARRYTHDATKDQDTDQSIWIDPQTRAETGTWGSQG